MSKLVKHPETGKPVYEEVSYLDVERGQLENEVNAKQLELDDATRSVEEAKNLVAEREAVESKAEVALGEAKSNLGTYDEIAPQPTPEPGAEGTSGENADQNAEGQEPAQVQF